jgi:HAD superfamily phosphatase (TIGR01668 family)
MTDPGPASGPKSRFLRPDFCFRRIVDIDLDWVRSLGVRGLLLDMDNTLTRWEILEVPAEELAWLEQLERAGLKTRLLTNGLAHKRRRVADQIGISCVSTALFKPIPYVFSLGLRELELRPDETMMIGDSVFTDVMGANRVGIWTALVEPLSQVDFVGTKLYRLLETKSNLRRPLHSCNDFREAGRKAAAESP